MSLTLNGGVPPIANASLHKETRLLSSSYFAPITLCLLCILVYQSVFTHTILDHWDDQWVAVNAYTDAGFNLLNIKRVFTEFYRGQYAPLNEMFYIIIHAMFGYSGIAFHTACLLIHMSNVLLVYYLIRKVLRQSNALSDISQLRIPFITAVIFAVHPFLVESVAWISASKNSLYATFYLIALLTYLDYIKTARYRYFLLTMLFFILSFGAKEQAVTLPACLLLFDHVLGDGLKKKSVWYDKVPFFLFSLFFGVVTLYSQAANGEGVLTSNVTYPFYQRIPMCAYTLSEYTTKCIVPLKLSYLYPFPILLGEPLQMRFWIYPIVLVLIVVSFWSFWKKKWIFFGVGFFLIHILLVSNLVSLARNAIVADRYVYLASIGIFFTLAYLFDQLLNSRRLPYNITWVLIFLYVSALGTYAYQRSKVWHSVDTLKYELRQLILERPDYDQMKEKYEK